MVGSALIQKPVQASKFQKAFFLAQISFFSFLQEIDTFMSELKIVHVNNTLSHDAF